MERYTRWPCGNRMLAIWGRGVRHSYPSFSCDAAEGEDCSFTSSTDAAGVEDCSFTSFGDSAEGVEDPSFTTGAVSIFDFTQAKKSALIFLVTPPSMRAARLARLPMMA